MDLNQIGYCMKCKEKREIQKPELRIMKNGMKAVKGYCKVCEGNMFKIMPKYNKKKEVEEKKELL